MQSLKEQLNIVDEEYLIGIANKGIVNRSKKELEETEITLNFTDTGLDADFPDGIRVTLGDSLNKFQCSCPSRSICKHVIMVIMKAIESVSGEAEGEKSSTGEPDAKEEAQAESVNEDISFEYLTEFTPEKLIKLYGKKSYNDAVFKIATGAGAEIEEGKILNIKLTDSLFQIRFLPNATLEESICSCKTKPCKHRLEAIIQYIKYKSGELNFDVIEQSSEAVLDVIPYIRKFIEEIFKMGIVRLPKDFSDKCSQYATLCHGAGFAAFERLFQSAASELELYEKKSASFRKNRLLGNLTKIYQMCNALDCASGARLTELTGKFKRQYMELPKINVYGVGSYPWYAKSGFSGITNVFYCPELKKTVTFGLSRPIEGEREAWDNIFQIGRTKNIWSLQMDTDAISKCAIELTGAKISDNSRLSASESTSGTMRATTKLTEEELAAYVFNDFSNAASNFPEDTEDTEIIYAVFKISKIKEGSFDKISQTYKTTVEDVLGNSMKIKIPYSRVNETAITNFEYLPDSGLVPEAMTVSMYVDTENREVVVFPIAVWIDDEVVNIGMKPLYSQDKAKSKYSKFFN